MADNYPYKPPGLLGLGAIPSSSEPLASGFAAAARPGGLMALGDLPPPFLSHGGALSLITERYRRRRDWNDRFAHWEKAESDSESQRIERARTMVQAALSRSPALTAHGVSIVPQGSYTNRTNTRNEADIDLRVQHPTLRVHYHPSIANPAAAAAHLGYYTTGRQLPDVAADLRATLETELIRAFGAPSVDTSGKKAIRVRGVDGSRGEVDVVPGFTLHVVHPGTLATGPITIAGFAICGLDGSWTYNYPDQHIANGRAKRLRTAMRFKKVVRTVKRLRADMAERQIYTGKVPSFLVECLVFLVEDQHFTAAEDDRYDRTKRVLTRALQLVSPLGLYVPEPTEINGIKPLFGAGQAWSRQDAIDFLTAALVHLGDA